MKEFNILIDDYTFHGYEYGDSNLPSLVCLHGMTGDSNSYHGLLENLKGAFHFILLDGPGHGGTSPFMSEEEYRFSSVVKRIKMVIDQIIAKPFYIMGHSWGADLALHFAIQFPEKIIGTILIDGGYVFPEHVEGMTREIALSGWAEYVDSSIYYSWDEVVKAYQEYTTKEWDHTLDSIIISNFNKIDGQYTLKADRFCLLSIIKAFYDEPCSTTYESIKNPVLLFHATVPTDDPSRERGLEKIKTSIDHVKVVGIENTKHNVQWDAPREVAKIILDWKDNCNSFTQS